MIKRLTFLVALLLPCCISAQERERRIKINFGAKAGFQAIAYNNPQFGIEGYEFDSDQLHSDRIGYTFSPFIRLTGYRFYLQAESVLGLAKHSFSFKSRDSSDNGKLLPNRTTYNLTTLCLQVPIVLGYNIVNEGKYLMSIFTGPKTKFVFTAHDKQEFKHFTYQDLEEVLKKRCYYWEFGLGVRIGHLFFDFIYDRGITKAADYIVSGNDGKKFMSDRKENIFSFSVGVIF